nr:efflux RND transporter periplasmic adaptor subunit [uncultured Roseateles sp.]
MLRLTVLAVVVATLLVACGKTPPDAKAKAEAVVPPLLISQEDLSRLSLGSYDSGPVITGSIQPEKRADLRAEVSAVVLQVLKENGEKVKRGDLIARLDDSAIRESLSSADESARAASQSFDQAERQYQRLRTLQAQGMSSMQAMEDAEVRRNNAQSDLVAAKARVATARQQIQRTEVRAPFDGVVSDRKVSPGDTAQIGKELVKVIDPVSMRFEGLVSADRMAELKVGETVFFRVNGYSDTDFQGKVRRIAAAANAATRQVEVLVDFAGKEAPAVAGLYAEGRVQTQTVSALLLPEASIQREGDEAFAWLVKGGQIAKTPLKLGARDERQGLYVVTSGLAAGDVVLRRPTSALQDGRKVEMSKAAVAAPAVPAASAAQKGA